MDLNIYDEQLGNARPFALSIKDGKTCILHDFRLGHNANGIIGVPSFLRNAGNPSFLPPTSVATDLESHDPGLIAGAQLMNFLYYQKLHMIGIYENGTAGKELEHCYEQTTKRPSHSAIILPDMPGLLADAFAPTIAFVRLK